MFSVLDALPTSVAEANTNVHAFGASIEPGKSMCAPFLKTSRRLTAGALVVAGESGASTLISRVCGTESAKTIRTTNVIIAAETQRRTGFIR